MRQVEAYFGRKTNNYIYRIVSASSAGGDFCLKCKREHYKEIEKGRGASPPAEEFPFQGGSTGGAAAEAT